MAASARTTDRDERAHQRRHQRRRREDQHMPQSREGNRTAHADIDEPGAEHGRRELHEEQHAGDGIGNLRREQLVRRQFGDEREPQERGPVARGIQQQEREQGTRGRPEHTHPLGGDEQREADANSEKMDRKVDGPRLQGT